MIFSSLLFIFQFIPIFFLIYYIVPPKLQNVWLLLGSLFFYAWGEPTYLPLMLASILVNYCIGRMIDMCEKQLSRGIWLLAGVTYNVCALAAFKYTGFIIENLNGIFGWNLPAAEISLPLGISFYTFQIMSYIIDLYRGETKVETSLLNLGVYVSMFPQLIAGPIVVYEDVAKELKKRSITSHMVADGLRTFILGLASKVLIANNIGALWNDLGSLGYGSISTPLAWLGIFAFTLQIYFDFNGYSLMAIGLGQMLGFHFPNNFNHPYISRSATEFWRRWHMTLSRWMRDYIYIPLGGSRKGTARTFLNLFVVWFITGMWHGAGWNFILWGLYFFLWLSLERLFLRSWLEKSRVFSHVYAIFIIVIGWMLFAITDFSQLVTYASRLFLWHGGTDWIYYLLNYGVIFVIGIVLSTPLLSGLYQKWKGKFAVGALLILLLLFCVAYLADASYNPFLYFRF